MRHRGISDCLEDAAFVACEQLGRTAGSAPRASCFISDPQAFSPAPAGLAWSFISPFTRSQLLSFRPELICRQFLVIWSSANNICQGNGTSPAPVLRVPRSTSSAKLSLQSLGRWAIHRFSLGTSPSFHVSIHKSPLQVYQGPMFPSAALSRVLGRIV